MAVTVTSSQAIVGTAQKDGRSYVQEIIILSTGQKDERIYLAPAGFDTAAHLSNAAVQIIADLTAAEINANVSQVMVVGSLASPTLVFSTAADNFAALRAAFATATQVQVIMVGDYLSGRTDGQLQTAFGMTAGQVTTLRANKLTPDANLATSIRAAVGQ